MALCDTGVEKPKCLSCSGILGLLRLQQSVREGTWQMKHTSWSSGLVFSGDGSGMVANAGVVAVRLLADRVGLTAELSAALTRPGFVPGHDRGQVLVDVATMLTAGGEAISDIDTLRQQRPVVGAVASTSTVWRTLDGIDTATGAAMTAARARSRARVWGLLGRRPVAARAAGQNLPAGLVVLDVDATLVIAHSEKEQAAPTYKRTFGYHPIGVWCDNTGEMLAMRLRPGNAGANTAADNIAVIDEAITQVPAQHRRRLLVRSDSAGASHALIDHLAGLNIKRSTRVEYSIGFAITDAIREAITAVPKKAWTPAIDADGDRREHADVVEITPLVSADLRAGWPTGMRFIARREHPHPGAQLSLLEQADGYRYQVFVTNTTVGKIAFLEARHRAHARVEDRIKDAKDTGLRRFPSRVYAINQAWLHTVALAADLTCWLRLLALPPSLKHCRPKALRYRLLHVPAKLTHSARRRHVRFPADWPWTHDILATFVNVCAIPAPG